MFAESMFQMPQSVDHHGLIKAGIGVHDQSHAEICPIVAEDSFAYAAPLAYQKIFQHQIARDVVTAAFTRIFLQLHAREQMVHAA